MADLSRPDVKPRWASGASAAVTEPTEPKKDLGWVAEKPPHEYYNWLELKAYQWLEYLHSTNKSGVAPFIPLLSDTLGMQKYLAKNDLIATGVPGGVKDCTFGAGFMWVTTAGANNLLKVDITTNTIVSTIGGFTTPHGVVYSGRHADGNRYLWVINRAAGGTVSKVNIETGAIVATVNVGVQPSSGCFDGTHVWVGNDGGTTVDKINIETNAIDASVTVGNQPHGMAFDGTHVWVCNFASANLSKINISTDVVDATVGVGTAPDKIAFDGTHMWAGNRTSDTVSKVDPVADAVVATVTLTGGDQPNAIVSDGRYIWVVCEGADQVKRIDIHTATVTHTITVPGAAGRAPQGGCFDGYHVWAGLLTPGELFRIQPI